MTRERHDISALCYDGDHPLTQPFKTPRRLAVDGRDAAVVSNGHALVVLWGREADFPPFGDVEIQWKANGAYGHLSPEQFARSGPVCGPPAFPRRARFDDLVAFAGPVIVTEACGRCDGTGFANVDDWDCVECEATGEVYPEPEAVDLGGERIDRKMLARTLSIVDDCEEVVVRAGRLHDAPAFRIDGDGWRIVLMGLSDPGHPDERTVVESFASWLDGEEAR